MLAIVQSFLLVAVSEMGDKTQLLAFILASRFRKPWTIMAGILVATVFNHLLAASVGGYASHLLSPEVLKYLLAATFVGFGLWILLPDSIDEDEEKESKWGAFFTTVVAFFLAEMGDKTQLATVALAARFQNIYLVTVGTTLGMMVSDGLAVFFGERITKIIPMKWIRAISCALFIAFGILILIQ